MNKEEFEYADFLQKRIIQSGGSIRFQHLTGHLSQLPTDVRNSVGNSKEKLMKFLRMHNDVFTIDEKGIVSVKQSSTSDSVSKHSFKTNGTLSHKGSQESLINKIENGLGIVTKIFPAFGFINAKDPFKTSVYFTAANFKDGQYKLLTDAGLFIGCKVHFNAVIGKSDFEAKYRATSVWQPDKEEKPMRPNIPKIRKTRDSGLYDPMTLEGDGVIQNVFPTHGFIYVNDETKSIVFFHKHKLCKFSNVTDLTQILKIGDLVEFTAMRSTKKDTKVRWEGTKVWLKKTIAKEKEINEEMDVSDVDDDSVSDKQSKHSFNNKQEFNERYLRNSNCVLEKGTMLKFGKKFIQNQSGKLYPRASGSVIKFGNRFSELADADSGLFYLHGAKVLDKTWEFSEGDNVQFDAIQIKSTPGWKVVLAWVGTKPDVVLSSSDFGFPSDDELDEIPDSDSNASSSVRVPRQRNNQKISKKSNHDEELESFAASRKYKSKSSLSSHDLDSEFDSGISSHRTHRGKDKPKESVTSLNVTKRGETTLRSLQSSRASSLSSLTSSRGSKKHKSFEVKKGKSNFQQSNFSRKSEFNWGDTPYAGDESDSPPFIDTNIKTFNCDTDSVSSDSEEEYITSLVPPKQEEGISRSSNKMDSKIATATNNADKDAVSSDSDEEYISSLVPQEKEKGKPKSDNIMDSSDATAVNSTEDPKSQKAKPYIKLFEGIIGTITETYSRFVKIKSPVLRNSVVCGFIDIYRNGTSISDHFDDIREVMRVGDTLKFNCFEVLDDNGTIWEVISMAWTGPKPNVEQMTKEEFLSSRGDISVTITEESEVESVLSQEKVKAPNKNSEEPVLPKFLAVTYSNFENEPEVSEDDYSSVISADDLPPASNTEKKCLMEASENQKNPRVDKQTIHQKLAEKISRRLMCEGVLNTNAMENIHNLSMEIVSMVFKESQAQIPQHGTTNTMETSSSSYLEERKFFHTDDLALKDNLLIKKKDNLSSKAVQTIITGEVIAQSIFTQ